MWAGRHEETSSFWFRYLSKRLGWREMKPVVQLKNCFRYVIPIQHFYTRSTYKPQIHTHKNFSFLNINCGFYPKTTFLPYAHETSLAVDYRRRRNRTKKIVWNILHRQIFVDVFFFCCCLGQSGTWSFQFIQKICVSLSKTLVVMMNNILWSRKWNVKLKEILKRESRSGVWNLHLFWIFHCCSFLTFYFTPRTIFFISIKDRWKIISYHKLVNCLAILYFEIKKTLIYFNRAPFIFLEYSNVIIRRN